jgi:predicted membrane protein
MGCGCLVALLATLSPRVAIFAVWLFTDRMSVAFDHFWMGLAGFILLPWTTLAWAVVYAPVRGVTGFGWFFVILGLVVDLSTHVGTANARREKRAAA